MAKTPDRGLQLVAALEPRGPACAIVLSDEQVASLGGGARPPVQVTINGRTARARVARMGGENLLGFSKKLRADLAVEIGQTVEAHIVLDTGPRIVEIPAAPDEALRRDPEARATFDRLAFTHRKEYARWVDEAKQEKTRQARIDKTLQMLHEGRTRR
jgi:hypothetical protein